MNKVRINEEMLMRLKQRFNVSVNELDLSTFEVYSKNNLNQCPYTVVKNKISQKPNTLYLVNELKNMVLAGKFYGKNVTMNTALYLDGREGYKTLTKF